MIWNKNDYKFMSLAIELAKRGKYTCSPNPCVGCVITRDNQVLGQGWHAIAGHEHAEIMAIKSADSSVVGATFYITLEPCSYYGKTPPCVDSLIEKGVKEVIISMRDPNPKVSGKSVSKLKLAGINVREGLLEAESMNLNLGFIKRMEKKKPYVRCKMAMSLDAKTSLSNGKSQWISGEKSRKDVHELRAASDAILTSSNNIIKDDPLLTTRDISFKFKQAVRVIIDRKSKTPDKARLFLEKGKVLIYSEKESKTLLKKPEVEILTIVNSDDWLDKVFTNLAIEQEINEVFVEAGGYFCGLLLELGLIDELIFYMAPILMGHDANSLFRLNKINKLDDAIKLDLIDIKQFGQDIRLIYKPLVSD